MTDEEFVRRRYPDARLASRQAGVYSEYAVQLGGWPPRFLSLGRFWDKRESVAWRSARLACLRAVVVTPGRLVCLKGRLVKPTANARLVGRAFAVGRRRYKVIEDYFETVPGVALAVEELPAPPGVYFRMTAGDTLVWVGPQWQDGLGPKPTRAFDCDADGYPVDPDGRPLAGCFLPGAAGKVVVPGRPSRAVPSPTQEVVLERCPLPESEANDLTTRVARSLRSVFRAGWVYWQGPAGLAELFLTDAGRTALALAKARRRSRLKRG